MNGKQLKNSILQWAIQGKLVPQDPNDEPASVLLENIRAEKARLVKEGKIKKDKNESIIYRGDDNSHYEKFADGTVKCIEDEIPFEIPDSWVWIRLGTAFKHSTGKALNSSNKIGILRKYLTTSNVYWNYFKLSNLKQMYFTDDELEKCMAHKGDLLVLEGGDIGRAAIWNEDYGICLQNHIHKLTPYVCLDIKFYYFNMLFYHDSNMVDGKGIGIQGLSSGKLHNIILPLPPIEEQHRIVNELGSLFPKIEKYGKCQDELDLLNNELKPRLQKSILQEAIQGKLVEQDPTAEPAARLLERIRTEKQELVKQGKLKKSELNDSVIFKGEDNKYYEQIGNVTKDISEEIPFEIPENWVWSRFSSVVNYRIGKTPERGNSKYWIAGNIPWVSISDMKDYGVIDSTRESITEDAAKECFKNRISQRGSLLMSFKLTIGRTSILSTDAYHNEAIITIIPYIDDNYGFRNYLKYIMPVTANVGDSKDAIKGKTLNSKSIAQLLLPIPPIEEQIRIVNKYELLLQKLM